jgi:hypothetical protein
VGGFARHRLAIRRRHRRLTCGGQEHSAVFIANADKLILERTDHPARAIGGLEPASVDLSDHLVDRHREGLVGFVLFERVFRGPVRFELLNPRNQLIESWLDLPHRDLGGGGLCSLYRRSRVDDKQNVGRGAHRKAPMQIKRLPQHRLDGIDVAGVQPQPCQLIAGFGARGVKGQGVLEPVFCLREMSLDVRAPRGAYQALGRVVRRAATRGLKKGTLRLAQIDK